MVAREEWVFPACQRAQHSGALIVTTQKQQAESWWNVTEKVDSCRQGQRVAVRCREQESRASGDDSGDLVDQATHTHTPTA